MSLEKRAAFCLGSASPTKTGTCIYAEMAGATLQSWKLQNEGKGTSKADEISKEVFCEKPTKRGGGPPSFLDLPSVQHLVIFAISQKSHQW